MTQDIRKYDYIDALRGYAILAVLLVHSSQAVAPASRALQSLAADGARGVQLFFVASALTLSMSWEFRRSHESSPTRNFFLRRLFRIAPMFYLAILFYFLLYGFSPRYWAPDGIQWWFVPLTALFLNGFLPQTITSVVPGGWSIAVEMNFYLVLPLLLRYLTTRKSLAAFLLFSLASYAGTRWGFSHLFAPHFPPDQQYLVANFVFLNFFGQLPIFVIGLLVYSLIKNPVLLRRFLGYGSSIYIAVIILCLLLHVAIDNYLFIGFGLALFACFLACYPNTILVSRSIVQIGKISFSMYLIHFAVLEAFAKLGFSAMFPQGDVGSIFHYVCVVAATAPLSYCTYRAIERPGIQVGKRLIDLLERSGPRGVQQAAGS